MSVKRVQRLSIGEFAAATQLSPKALRLYDEQKLLQPAAVDPASGYRYYRSDQVPLGRLVRTLRDMGASLADAARIVGADGASAETLLREYARELDARYAQQKRAFQSALLMLRDGGKSDRLSVAEHRRPAMTVLVRPFTVDRARFYQRLRKELHDVRVQGAAPEATASWYCRFVDPLSDDESRVELLSPIATLAQPPAHIDIRPLPEAACAVIAVRALDIQGADFTGALDAIFDWFDRRGYRAIDEPWLAGATGDGIEATQLTWAYAPDLHAVS